MFLTAANDFLENLESSRGTCNGQKHKMTSNQRKSLIVLPGVIHRPVLQVLDQGYRGEDVQLARYHPEYAGQGCKCRAQVNTWDQVCQGLSVKNSLWRVCQSAGQEISERLSIQNSILGDIILFAIITITNIFPGVGVDLHYGLVEKVNQVLGHWTGIIWVSEVKRDKLENRS